MPGLLDFGLKAGATLGGGYLANRLSKSKPTPQESSVINNALGTMANQNRVGTSLVNSGIDTVTQPRNYWADILSGDRSKVTSAMAPEISRIAEGYQTARNTAANLNPRSGQAATLFAELPYRQQKDISTLMQGARPEAAKNLSGVGSNLIQQGTSALQSATAAGRDILQQQEQQRQAEAERGKSIGSGLFDFMNKYGDQVDLGEKLKGLLGIGAGAAAKAATAAAPWAGAGGAGSTAATASLIPGAAPMSTGGIGATVPGGGLSHALISLAQNPITAGVAAAALATTLWLKSQAHHEANTWVKGFQNPFDQKMHEIESQYKANAGGMTPEQKAVIRNQVQDLVNGYMQKMQEFRGKGKDERKVADQAKATADMYYGPNFNRFLAQFA